MTTTLKEPQVKDYLHFGNEVPYHKFQVYYRLGLEGETYQVEDPEENGEFMWRREETYHWEVFQPLAQSYFASGRGFCEGEFFYYLEELINNFKSQLVELKGDYHTCLYEWDNLSDKDRGLYKDLDEFWFDDWGSGYGNQYNQGDQDTYYLMAQKLHEFLTDEDIKGGKLSCDWDYEIKDKTLSIYLILNDGSAETDTRKVDTKPLYDTSDWDDYGDLEELDRGECPWDFTLSTDDRDDLTRYVLTRFLWNQLEGWVNNWEDQFDYGTLPYLNNDTLRLMRFLENNPDQEDNEDLWFPGLEDETLSHYRSLMGSSPN